MSWQRRWPTHGGRGPKPLEGRAAAAHVGCCVLWLCGCVVARVLSPFCRVDHPPHGDIFPLFNARTNAKLLTPSRADTSQCTGEVSAAVKKGGMQVGLAFILRGQNMHFLCTSVRYLGSLSS